MRRSALKRGERRVGREKKTQRSRPHSTNGEGEMKQRIQMVRQGDVALRVTTKVPSVDAKVVTDQTTNRS